MTHYSEEFKAKMEKDQPHLCDTCNHQIRGMQNGCRAGIHELGLVWQCMNYEYYGPSRQDIDEAMADAGKPKQVGGDHYSRMKIQPWDFEQGFLTHEQFVGHLLAAATEYISRYNVAGVEGKGGRQDIEKAKHYLEKLLEVLK